MHSEHVFHHYGFINLRCSVHRSVAQSGKDFHTGNIKRYFASTEVHCYYLTCRLMAVVPAIVILANQIKQSIEATLDPYILPTERQKNFQLQEEFKSSSPHCADVGFYLSDANEGFSYPIRLCGLQFIDFFIKTKWNDLSYEKKSSFKEKALMFLQMTPFNEHLSLKESIAKIVVEIIKRSWPQQWSSLFKDLSDLQNQGKPQTEMVLIVLLRLSEDINGFDPKLTPQRKKDMLATITDNAADLFHFFLVTLEENASQLGKSNDEVKKRLAEAALYTITEYSSWVNFEIILAKDKVLFQYLFLLLENDSLRMAAANCLEVIFTRKGANEKRVEFMVILSEDVLNIVGRIVRSLNLAGGSCQNVEDYAFLKKVTSALSIFARNQIAMLWGDEKGFSERPKCFDMFVLLMLELMSHKSLKVPFTATEAFHSFIVHEQILKDSFFQSIVPDLLQKCFINIRKNFNSKVSPNPWKEFNELDFEDIDVMKKFFSVTLGQNLDIVRRFTQMKPFAVMEFCIRKMEEAILIPQPHCSGFSEDEIVCTDYWIAWDGLAHFARQFFLTLFKNTKNPNMETINNINSMFKTLLNMNFNTTHFIFPAINMIESMLPIINFSQDNLIPLIQMLNSIMNSGDDCQMFKLKRQACVLFNNLTRETPTILVQIFEHLEVFVNEHFSKENLTVHEKSLLIEGLIRISKHLKDKQKQHEFLKKTFSYIKSVFSREDIQLACQHPKNLIEFLGLNKSQVTDELDKQRKELLLGLYVWLGCTKALSFMENGKADDNISDNDLKEQLQTFPWIQDMISILPMVFELTKQYTLIWSQSEELSNLNVLKHTTLEQSGIMGILGSKESQKDESLGKGQFYMSTLHEIIYTGLGFCSLSIGPSLYSLDGFADVIVDKIVNQWTHLPNLRLQRVLKHFVKVFVLCCPRRYYIKTLAPFLSAVFKLFLQILSSEWEKIRSMNLPKTFATSDGESENKEGEVREERLIYALSREFIDMIIVFCTFKREKKILDVKPPPGSIEMIGDLGNFLLEFEGTNVTLISIIYSAITWPDTSVAAKLTSLLIAVTRKVFVASAPVDESIPDQLFMQLLKSLEIHGSEEMSRNLIINATLQVYIHLREQYPNIVKLMLMLPSCQERELQKFDLSVFMNENPLKESERKKKFASFLSAAFGKNVSGLHARNIQIKDLPPLAPREKPKPKVEILDDDAAICNLFVP